MPSKEKELAVELQKSGFYTSYLKHIADIKTNKEEIKRRQKELENSDKVFNSALDKVNNYLPEGVIDKYPKPTIAFMIFGPDGRGYETILVDLVYFLQNEKTAVGFIAHEMHHYYMTRESVFREGEAELLWVLRQIYAEGLADQIDKRDRFFTDPVENSNRAVRFRELVKETPEVIMEMDNLLKEMVMYPESYNENALKIRGLVPLSGHPTGYYMVNAVMESSGAESLVCDFGNPFSFFRRYNTTARESNGKYPAFCDESMQLISELENRYAR
jgi:hypothetical protein